MADKDKGIVDQICDRVDNVIDFGNETANNWLKKIMCFMIAIIVFLSVVFMFITALGGASDATGLTDLFNVVMSLFSSGADAVNQVPASDVPPPPAG